MLVKWIKEKEERKRERDKKEKIDGDAGSGHWRATEASRTLQSSQEKNNSKEIEREEREKKSEEKIAGKPSDVHCGYRMAQIHPAVAPMLTCLELTAITR